jgi:hypothetical protein
MCMFAVALNSDVVLSRPPFLRVSVVVHYGFSYGCSDEDGG